MAIQFGAFAVVVVLQGRLILSVIFRPRSFIRARRGRRVALGERRFLILSVLYLLAYALAGAAAWRHADLGIVWLAESVITGVGALALSFGALVGSASKAAAAEPQPHTPETLMAELRWRRRALPANTGLLLLWVYSWRHLFV